jgi:UDP-N-acetylglucosamine acyltransferase
MSSAERGAQASMPAQLKLHPSAVIGPQVELAAGGEIGPFCPREGRIRLGPGCRLLGHVTILGDSELGSQNILHPNVVIGDEPQDVAYTGGSRRVLIGNGNIFREGVTVHRGSEQGDVTIIGNGNFFMQNAHAAHDCHIGNNAIIAGGALLAGWVEVGDGAIVSGNCVVHQFVRLGRYSMMRGLSRTSRDVPPFCLMDGTHTLRSINLVGLRRAGGDPTAAQSLRVTLSRTAKSEDCYSKASTAGATFRRSRRNARIHPAEQTGCGVRPTPGA